MRLVTRVLAWMLCAVVVAAPGAAQVITGVTGATTTSAVGGTCATGNAVAKFVGSQTLDCEATTTLNAGVFTTPRVVIAAAANTVPLTITHSVTNPNTTSMVSWTSTINTTANVHLNDMALTVTAAGASSTAFRIRGGAGGATDLFSVLLSSGRVVAAESIYAGGSQAGVGFLSASAAGFNSRSIFTSTADGLMTISSFGGNAFTRLNFGGNTSAFPAIARSTNTFQFVNGDNTAFISIYVAGLGLSGTGTVSGAIAGTEITEPSAPAANQWLLFAKDNGAGKTQLCVKFATGVAQCFGLEP